MLINALSIFMQEFAFDRTRQRLSGQSRMLKTQSIFLSLPFTLSDEDATVLGMGHLDKQPFQTL